MKIIHKDIVDSTNSEVIRLADCGEAFPFWLYADKQTNGRGRRGHSWQSIDGNLFASGIYEFAMPPQHIATLSFVVSLALFASLGEYIDKAKINLKWPNDILIDGNKLSGILLESYFIGKKLRLVIGVGVNITGSPDINEYGTISIAECLKQDCELPSAFELLQAFIEQFEKLLKDWENGQLVAILQEWKKFAYNLNKKIHIKYGNEIIEGIFEDIEDSGELKLKLANGKYKLINAGEVFI